MLHLVALVLLSQQTLQPVAEGVASYYTVASSSRTTASGDHLNDGLYTCAMREGEFGDLFLVVADNGKSVLCRLNDRGPFKKGRVIDLSKAAMRQLGPTGLGTLRVKVYKVGVDSLLDFFKAS